MSGDYVGYGRLDVTGALDRAIQHAKRVLFRPFDMGKWLSFGVIVFLEVLLQGGGGFNFNLPSNRSSGSGADVGEIVRAGHDWVVAHLAVILMIGIPLLVFAFAFGIVMLWLRSHGQVMLIRAVAENDARIGENWRETRAAAWSLFLFRLVLNLISFTCVVLALAIGVVLVLGIASRGGASAWHFVMGLLPLLGVGLTLALVLTLIQTLLRNFVSPLMVHLDLPCLAAWSKLREIARGNLLRIALFILIRFVYLIAFGIAALLVGCLTCCIGFLPVIHQALFAPFYVFDRAYSLYVLESAGPDLRIISPPEAQLVTYDTIPDETDDIPPENPPL